MLVTVNGTEGTVTVDATTQEPLLGVLYAVAGGPAVTFTRHLVA